MILQRTDCGLSLNVSGRSVLWMGAVCRLLGVKSLAWNALGYGDNCNLSFLKAYPPLDALRVIALRLNSVSGIEEQRLVRELALETYARGSVPWNVFDKLESLVCESHLFTGKAWECSQLQKLFLINCTESDWSNLIRLPQLRELELSGSKIQSFHLVQLPELTKLGLYHSSEFADFHGVAALQRLTTLTLDSCRRISSVTPIGDLRSLMELNIVDCGKIHSINWCLSLKNLQKLRLYGTRVLDGKLRCVLELPELRELCFDDWGGYDITSGETSNILAHHKQ